MAADVEAPPAPPAPPAVPFREVLRTADAWDILLMITGSICGAACGAVQPWCAKRAGAALVVSSAARLCGPRSGRMGARAARRGAQSPRRPAAALRPRKERGAAGGLARPIAAPRGASAPLHRRCATPRLRCDLPRACMAPWRLAPRRAASNWQPRTPETLTPCVPAFCVCFFAQLYAHLRLPRRHARLRHHHEREPSPRHPLVLLPWRWGAHHTPHAHFPWCPPLTPRPCHAAAASVAGYLEIACWELAGIRQSNRIRHAAQRSARLLPRPSPTPRADRRPRRAQAAVPHGAAASGDGVFRHARHGRAACARGHRHKRHTAGVVQQVPQPHPPRLGGHHRHHHRPGARVADGARGVRHAAAHGCAPPAQPAVHHCLHTSHAQAVPATSWPCPCSTGPRSRRMRTLTPQPLLRRSSVRP